MAKLNFKNGFTSVILRVKIMDSTSTTGAAKTGLTSATAGLIISTIADNEAAATVYAQASSNIETITTLGTFAAPTAGKCRFKEIDSTNHPGLYEIQIADARWAVSNARSVIVSVLGATGAAQVDAEIQLEPVPSNVRQLLDTAWLTPGTAGTPDVNAKQIGGTAQTAGDLAGILGALNTAASSGDPGTTTTLVAYLKQIVNTLEGTAGIPTFPSAAVAANAVSLAEVIRSIDSRLPGALASGNMKVDALAVNGVSTSGVTSVSPYIGSTGAAVNGTNVNTLASHDPGATLASSTEVTSIQNNTRCVRVVPDVIERPDSGTATYRVELLLYDEVGNMEAPDSAPTLALVNQSGTDLSGRLDSTTGTLVSAGRYRWVYTADVADTLEQLVWAFSVVEGGVTRIYGNTSVIVDTSAVDFTASDRTKLNTLATDYTTARAAKLDNLDATVSSRLASASYTAPLDAAGTRSAVGLASANLDTQLSAIAGYIDTEVAAILAAVDTEVAAIKAKTDNLPADPADASDIASSFGTVNTTLATIAAYIDTEVSAIKAKTDNLPDSPAAVGSAMTLADGAITDAKIALPTEASGTPSTALQLLMWIAGMLGWRKVVKDSSGGTIKQYMADGTTVKTTSSFTTVTTTDTLNKAS